MSAKLNRNRELGPRVSERKGKGGNEKKKNGQ